MNDKKLKVCIECREAKGEDSFRRDKCGDKVYIRKMCKKCSYETDVKLWRNDNKEGYREHSARTYRRRKAKYHKKHGEWRRNNIELKRAMDREYYYRKTRGKGTTLIDDSGVGYARRRTINKDRSYVEEEL